MHQLQQEVAALRKGLVLLHTAILRRQQPWQPGAAAPPAEQASAQPASAVSSPLSSPQTPDFPAGANYEFAAQQQAPASVSPAASPIGEQAGVEPAGMHAGANGQNGHYASF